MSSGPSCNGPITAAVDRFVYGTQPRFICVHDYGEGSQELEMHEGDMTSALLAPASFAAVVADLCGVLKASVPNDVERALSGEHVQYSAHDGLIRDQ